VRGAVELTVVSRTGTVALALVAAAGAVVYATVAWLDRGGASGAVYWFALAGGSAVLAAGIALAPRATPRAGLLVVLAGAALFRFALVPTAPALSHDLYRYLWDGRVAASGVNPYAHPPAAPELAPLRDVAVWEPIHRKPVLTIYPPGAQALFTAAHAAGLRTPTGLKLLLVASDFAAVVVLARLLAARGRNPSASVAYAWNPLPVIAFGHSGHVDSVVVLALLLAALAWQRRRHATVVGALLGLAAAVKLFPLLVVPAFVRTPDGRFSLRRAATVAASAGLVVAVGYPPYLGANVLGFLSTGYFTQEGYVSGNRFLLTSAVGLDGVSAFAVVTAVLVAIGVAVLAARRNAAARAAWLLGAALVATTPYPWYAAPLVALAVGGGAGWLWPWFGLALEAAYIAVFHRISGYQLAVPVRAAASAGVVVLAVAATRWAVARRAVIAADARHPEQTPPPVATAHRELTTAELARVCAVLPALDEADALPAALAGRPAGLRTVVVDNGSTDGTAAVARRLGAEVVVEERRGFGAACWRGLQASAGADVVVFLDADASLDWGDLGSVAGPVLDGRADLVLGHRRRELRARGAMPWHVGVANRLLGSACGLVAGVPLADVGPYRAARRDALLTLGVRDRSYGWPLEMVLRAGRAGLRVAEVPVRYHRRVGTSKVTGQLWPTCRAAARMAIVLVRLTFATR
jgi:hypothetical protein